jgi:polyprenyl P-hydroxybenzoate/phenylacrylic acid decarboxylase-like protein
VTSKSRLVIGMSGSSAPQLGVACLRALHELASVETHLVMSRGAKLNLRIEAGIEPEEVEAFADYTHDVENLAAPISSGSFQTLGTLVVPCSMRMLSAIATGNSGDLISRAADVAMKERRRLVLVCRETPLNLIHIRNMETATLSGAVILPPVMAFYHGPQSVDHLVNHIVGKALDQFGIEHDLFRRWS